MESNDKKELEYLKEKYQKNEKILIKAYDKIKLKEKELKEAFENLKANEEELRASNEEINAINEELLKKNEFINIQNQKLKDTLKELRETQIQLIQSEKMASLGTLTAGVAHEINNPLNYIMGAYIGLEDYFMDHGSRDNTTTSILLNSISEGIEKISKIVQGLNQFSQDNERFDEYCDIHAIINNCLVMLNSHITDKVKIIQDLNTEPVVVKGNVGKLHQVFINILTNSIQAIENNGNIIIETKIELNQAIIVITDNGHGISKENIKQIMDPFFTTKAPGKGTGLGLSIAYSIIKKHKGTIMFESELYKGTTAIIKLPKNS